MESKACFGKQAKVEKELTKRQLQVLPCLLACPTYEEAARQAHVSVKQIYCWLKTSAFKADSRGKSKIMSQKQRLKRLERKTHGQLIAFFTLPRGLDNRKEIEAQLWDDYVKNGGNETATPALRS